MAGGTLYYEDVQIGQEIPPLVRRTGFMEWNRFAAANEEFVMIHMDDEAGRAAMQPAAFGMGNLRYSYMHCMVLDWIGHEGKLRKLGIQYRGINLKNDLMTCTGKVTAKYVKDGEPTVELEIGVINQRGENTAPGMAVVVLPTRAG